MLDSLSTIIRARALTESAVTLRLLRARNLPLIISFLYREFKAAEQISIPYPHLHLKLADYLEEVEYADEDEELKNQRLLLDNADKAKLYLDRWIEAHYLRGMVDDTSKVLYIMLSKHTEKAFQIFELLKNKEFVGAESKFRDIFYKLRDITENANPDKEKRLAELEKRKAAIEEEIRRIRLDGYVSTYEDYQIKSRFRRGKPPGQ